MVAATHRVLEDEVRRGNFREDLYYRLNTLSVRLPPLRERGDDVLVLARYFLGLFASEYKTRARGFSPQALAALRKHAWPGNVRELRNRIQRAVVLAERSLLRPEDLELSARRTPRPVLPLAQAREEFQRRYIEQILERNGGNRTRAARELGVDPRTVFRFLEKQEATKPARPVPRTAGRGAVVRAGAGAGALGAAALRGLPACPRTTPSSSDIPPPVNQPPAILESQVQPSSRDLHRGRRRRAAPTSSSARRWRTRTSRTFCTSTTTWTPATGGARHRPARAATPSAPKPPPTPWSFADAGPVQTPGMHLVEVLVADGPLVNGVPVPRTVTLAGRRDARRHHLCGRATCGW